MREKAASPLGFRPKGKNAERLAFANRIGLNCSDLINRALDKSLQSELEQAMREHRNELERRKTELETALAMPVP